MGGKRYTLENIILRAKEIFGDKYDYISIEKKGKYNYINYICKEHGLNSQLITNHLKGCGCKFCGIDERANKRRMSFDTFVKKANQIHSNKYEYLELVNKQKERTYIKYICQNHGIQYQEITNHLKGCGCYKCGGTKKLTEEEIIERLKEKFGDNVSYICGYKNIDNLTTRFRCNVCHNEFENSLANVIDMINGCPYCSESIGAKKVRDYFVSLGVKIFPEKSYIDCKDKKSLPFDFYIPKYNLLIEYNGKQHYEFVNWTGNLTEEEMKNNLKIQRHHDWLKRKYALKNGYNFLTIPYWELNIINKILEEKIGKWQKKKELEIF